MPTKHDKKNNLTHITLEKGALIVFLDESGNENLSDINHPVFVVAGFCCDTKTFITEVNSKWREIKKNNLGSENAPLHANKIDTNNRQLLEDISEFFTKVKFGRIAYSFGSETNNEIVLSDTQIVCSDVATAILDLNNKFYSSKEIYVFVDGFTNGAHIYADHLNKAFQSALISPNYNSQSISVSITKANKTTLWSGNEIADMITHAAGCQARRYNAGNTILRRDYTSIFDSIDKAYIKHFHFISHKQK